MLVKMEKLHLKKYFLNNFAQSLSHGFKNICRY